MPRACPTQIRYGSGTINPKGERFDCFLWDGRTRYRSRQPNLEMARVWIDMMEDSKKTARKPLTNLQLADAQMALNILPAGTSLTEAARLTSDHRAKTDLRPILLSDALDEFLDAKAHGTAERTRTAYAQNVRQFMAMTGDKLVPSTSKADVEQFIAGYGPVTRNNKIRNLAIFFNWCAKKKYLSEPPTATVERSREQEPPKSVFTVKEAQALLWASESINPGMVPYLAIGLFSGMRPEELQKLPPSKIGKKYIACDGKVAKTRDARTIPILPNLRAWLDRYPPAGPRIHPPVSSRRGIYGLLQAICKAAKVEWKPDAMRHSYGSMAYEADPSHDAARIAADMGHHGTAIFFKHYRALAQPGDGKKYFAIRPKK
jgi:integrase